MANIIEDEVKAAVRESLADAGMSNAEADEFLSAYEEIHRTYWARVNNGSCIFLLAASLQMANLQELGTPGNLPMLCMYFRKEEGRKALNEMIGKMREADEKLARIKAIVN